MKIILSRKGFDSAAGGYPSPLFIDSALSILFPKNLYLYPVGFILLGILNLLSGLSCMKEGERLISRFLIIISIIAFAAAAAEFYIL